MRPYQIVATERILNRIEIVEQLQKIRHDRGRRLYLAYDGQRQNADLFQNGAACHKTADISIRCLFVVDRKDLDYQTMKEYDRFEKGAANSNTSTEDSQKAAWKIPNAKIIITTIQKLDKFISKNKETSRL